MDHSKLLEQYEYNQVTGEFVYLKNESGRTPIGSIAGSIGSDGYYLIYSQGKQHRRGRLAFFYMNKRWPDPEIDHIDRNPLNDSWINLREATSTEQKINMNIRKDNTSGVKGVSYDSTRELWDAYIFINRKKNRLGSFVEKEDAIAARKAAETQYY